MRLSCLCIVMLFERQKGKLLYGINRIVVCPFFVLISEVIKMKLDDLIQLVQLYIPSDVERIRKAYEFADILHKGQTRESGEDYITHPLNVAYILAEMHADGDTLCAALLHDTIEDTNTTKEDIADAFNKEVASLVDGVTKLAKMNFSSKEDQNLANTRKIITSITSDLTTDKNPDTIPFENAVNNPE